MNKYELEVVNTLRKLGIRANLQGYMMLKTAMNLIKENPSAIHKMMDLYAAIGERHNASRSKVERNIRNALETASGDLATQKEVLGTARELPVGEWLATLHESLMIKLACEVVG